MVRLGLICVLVLGLFSLARTEENLPLEEVFPDAVSFTAVKRQEEIIYYQAKDKDAKTIGAVFKANGKSHSSDIKTLVGMLKDGTITAIKVLSQNETLGLGSRITEPDFTDQFRNIKDLSGVQAISGATVSSSTVIESVKKRAEEIKQLIRGDQ